MLKIQLAPLWGQLHPLLTFSSVYFPQIVFFFYLTHATIYNLILSSLVSFISKAQRSNNIMILSSVTSIYM